jgi:hypothetical protein
MQLKKIKLSITAAPKTKEGGNAQINIHRK